MKSAMPDDTIIDFYQRAGIVHRLDKETSGVLLIAKNPHAFVHLQRQFKERLIKKEYLALVHGDMSLLEGEVNVPIGRLGWNKKRFGITPDGRESLTRYQVIKKYYGKEDNNRFSLLELYPKTGRTHQIRVHMKYLNHPIVADELYGGRKASRKDRKKLSRMFLHAKSITFTHPNTEQIITLSSTLPKELNDFLETLGTID
jgi:23S rRNA pseudouridine1911/1915/1917 synthase